MNTYYFDMSIDEDVENNYQEDRIPDILNPYLNHPVPCKTDNAATISYDTYVTTKKTRALKKNISIKNKPSLFVSTK
ncbi:acid-sensing ion channel [Acrasis kona]|uniref:Acid-sensing ion channel n=1 Tax=Acrasis kona TaxID=1008807 RepID=A0AAW2ZNV1_9EUKA